MRILIVKSDRSLFLLNDDSTIVRMFEVALGPNPTGPKTQLGDGRTPEGNYSVLEKRAHGQTNFYRAFYLSYPNQLDLQRAKDLGVDPGRDILIHGLKNGLGYIGRLHRLRNWTNGCIAVTNDEMDELWPHILVTTAVEIKS